MNTTLTQKTRGIVQILRPELPFAAGICVILGEIIALGRFVFAVILSQLLH